MLICSLLCFGAQNVMSFTKADRPIATKLRRLTISGNHAFNSTEIKAWFGLSKHDAISREELLQRGRHVLAQLNARGYPFARIDSVAFTYNSDSTEANVAVQMREGNRPKVAKFDIAGLQEDGPAIADDLRTKPSKPFDENDFEQDMAMLLRAYEENGYPYCEVRIKRFEVVAATATELGYDIAIDVQPGPRTEIGEIQFAGNEETRDYVILRELPVAVGDLYQQSKIDKIRPQMMKLGFFKWVNPPRLEWRDDGKARLIIEMAEGNNNRFDGVLGYNPATPTSPGFVTGLLDLRFGNLFGTGRLVDAHWQQRTAKTQNLRFGYTEPWLAGLPLNLNFSFEQLIQDTSYVQRDIKLGLSFLFNDNLALLSHVGTSETSPDSLGALRFGLPPSTSVNVGLGLSFDTTDQLLNPRRGVRYETSIEWRRKKIRSSSEVTAETIDTGSFNQRRLSIDFENYVSLFRWQVLAVALHGREVTTNEEIVQLTDQYRFGGTRSLRGYREEQFRGSRIAWSNIEYRYLVGPRSRFFLFTDLGYFFREDRLPDNSLSKIDDFKIGYGFGLRLDTRLGFFGIDYGLGEGDGFSNGKVHIGLTNEF